MTNEPMVPRCVFCLSYGSDQWRRSRSSWCSPSGWSGPGGTSRLCTGRSGTPGHSPAGSNRQQVTVCDTVCVCVCALCGPPCTDTVPRSRTLPPPSRPRYSHMVCSWGNHRNRERSGHTDVRPRCSYTWTSAKRPGVKILHTQHVDTAEWSDRCLYQDLRLH